MVFWKKSDGVLAMIDHLLVDACLLSICLAYPDLRHDINLLP